MLKVLPLRRSLSARVIAARASVKTPLGLGHGADNVRRGVDLEARVGERHRGAKVLEAHLRDQNLHCLTIVAHAGGVE